LDAPPHGAEIEAVHSATVAAADQGIRLIPVTGSGIDKATEFLMRYLAISTGGTTVFLTNESGIGGGHIESHIEGPEQTLPSIDIYPLNELLASIIGDYLE
jgi:hypothetical protein